MDDDARRQHLIDDGFPPPEILDAWEVPEPSADAFDRMFSAPVMEREMQAAPNNSRRSLLAPVAVGFLVAAGLLLSFWIGRSSVEPRVIETPAPPPVIVTEPAVACACPEPVAAPPCPEPQVVPDEPAPTPAPAAGQERRRPTPRHRSDALLPPRSNDLKNPFEADSNEATLHIGTSAGHEPAEIFIDRRRRGMTPLANVHVAPGRHVIEFRFADGRIVRQAIDIDAGDTRVIRAE